jgi:hypothetical protein
MFMVFFVCLGTSCFFPVAWHGEYFHLGYSQPLIIVNSSISGKGRCVENLGSQYIMEDKEYGEKCWRCMTIFRKHQNVLQYRESKLNFWFSVTVHFYILYLLSLSIYISFRSSS